MNTCYPILYRVNSQIVEKTPTPSCAKRLPQSATLTADLVDSRGRVTELYYIAAVARYPKKEQYSAIQLRNNRATSFIWQNLLV